MLAEKRVWAVCLAQFGLCEVEIARFWSQKSKSLSKINGFRGVRTTYLERKGKSKLHIREVKTTYHRKSRRVREVKTTYFGKLYLGSWSQN